MKTNADYTFIFDKFIGEITVPKGTKLTHKTAMGEDKNYHFVENLDWYKPELKGYARKMHIHDMYHKGIDIPKEFVDFTPLTFEERYPEKIIEPHNNRFMGVELPDFVEIENGKIILMDDRYKDVTKQFIELIENIRNEKN